MSIHQQIIDYAVDLLQRKLIDEIPFDDTAIAGVIKKGELQGAPDPDVARISVTVHENDPDSIVGGGVSSIANSWEDEIIEVEIGGCRTWSRKFTIKFRCLLDVSREDLNTTREIVSTLRDRIEDALLSDPFSGIVSGKQFVSRGPVSENFHAEMVQSGGPPDSYDYLGKIRFDVWTSNN